MQTPLVVSDRASLVHLPLPEGLGVEEWEAIGADLARAARAVQWLIGDWWRYGERRYGEAEAIASRLFPTLSYERVRHDGRTAAAFEQIGRRRPDLSFYHHEQVAALSAPLADRFLRRAARAKWSARELRAAVRNHKATERIGALVSTPLPTDAPVHVLYADPPWRYENPPIGDGNRAIENHYPTMTLDELKALEIGKCALEQAVLFMWATAPKLAECLELLEPWGFTYRTNLIWDKVDIGMGYYGRNQHELLLICRRGDLPTPPPELRVPSIYREKRGEHSRKPAYFAELIECWYPDLRKREFFSRDPARPGWLPPWGNQA